MGQLIYAEETYAIRGAVFDVYRGLGSGFLEAVYQECLEKEFKRRSLPYLPQEELKLTYKGYACSRPIRRTLFALARSSSN